MTVVTAGTVTLGTRFPNTACPAQSWGVVWSPPLIRTIPPL